MSQEIVKTQYVISLRNGMVAYIVADDLNSIAGALQTNKFFNTKDSMLVNTADIVAIMSPVEYEDQKKYVRGWYKSHRGTKWFNKKGEYEEETSLGESLAVASKRMKEVTTKEEAIEFLDKLSRSMCQPFLEEKYPLELLNIKELTNS